MERQLELLGLVADRIPATTPDDIEPATLAQHCDPMRPWWLTPPELACSLSHAKAMQHLLDSEEEHALILEDDVILSKSLPKFLATVDLNGLPSDLLRIETDFLPVRYRRRREPFSDYELLEPSGVALGCAGYLIGRKAVSVFLNWNELHRNPIDIALFTPYDWVARNIKVRHLSPALAVQMMWAQAATTFPSTLESHRLNKAKAEAQTGLRRWRNLFLRWLYDEIYVAGRKSWRQLWGDARKQSIPFAE